jgi:hypothetical protein
VRGRGETWSTCITAGGDTTGADYFLFFSRVKGKNDVIIDCKKVKESVIANKLV